MRVWLAVVDSPISWDMLAVVASLPFAGQWRTCKTAATPPLLHMQLCSASVILYQEICQLLQGRVGSWDQHTPQVSLLMSDCISFVFQVLSLQGLVEAHSLTSLTTKEEAAAVMNALTAAAAKPKGKGAAQDDTAGKQPMLVYVTPEKIVASKRLMSKLEKVYQVTVNQVARGRHQAASGTIAAHSIQSLSCAGAVALPANMLRPTRCRQTRLACILQPCANGVVIKCPKSTRADGMA